MHFADTPKLVTDLYIFWLAGVPFPKFLDYGWLGQLKMAFGINFEKNTYMIHKGFWDAPVKGTE